MKLDAGGSSAPAQAAAPASAPAAAPTWVHAANLHTTLQASSAVPHMHAALDRDRRLSTATALVRQQLALGVSPAQLKQRVMEKFAAAASAREQEALHSQMEAIVQQTQHLSEQNQTLQRALEMQGAQMTQQQAVSVGRACGTMARPCAMLHVWWHLDVVAPVLPCMWACQKPDHHFGCQGYQAPLTATNLPIILLCMNNTSCNL